MNFIFQGAAIYLLDRGSGPSILFMHGNPDSSDLWIPVTGHLPDCHCFAPDLPGFGRSDVPQDFDFSLESMSYFVDAVVREAEIPLPVHLVVHDFGGPFGLAWAVAYPEKVASITAMNTNFFRDYRWHFWARIWRTPILGELSMALMVWPIFRRAMKQGSRLLTDEQIRDIYEKVTRRMKRTVLKLYRATDPINFAGWDTRLVELTSRIPSLVLWGDRDPYISRRFAERFGARNVVHFPENGHWLPLEIPETIAQQIKTLSSP